MLQYSADFRREKKQEYTTKDTISPPNFLKKLAATLNSVTAKLLKEHDFVDFMLNYYKMYKTYIDTSVNMDFQRISNTKFGTNFPLILRPRTVDQQTG